ncbi:MAG TPA: helix-turn-helix transcriptional regulator [Woeseiaceae bacterium]|nr:helix-turn-helix transcriptional regulator [Woeseiaceae bacterium]
MSFAARLKEKRMRAGESLQELADALGMSKAHMWDLETGKSKNPSAEVLKKLSDHFKVSVAWWFGEELGDDEQQLRIMFRDLQELDEPDRELIQALIDKRKSQKEKKDGAD